MELLTGEAAREQIDRLRYLQASRSICALGSLTVPGYAASWHHRIKAAAIEEVIKYARFGGKRGGIPRLLISEPPQHGKSLHAGVLAPSLALGQDPDLKVIATAYDSTLAGRSVEQARTVMQSEPYRAVFPTRVGSHHDPSTGRTIAAKDQSTFFRTLREHPDGAITHAGGYFYSAGITAGLTGWGYQLGIMDDWIKDEVAATSPRMQLHRIGTYTKSFETRQMGPAGILCIGTMWDSPDWLDWLFDLWEAQGYDPVWLRFPALSDDTAKYPLHPDDPRAPGSSESLWPDRFPADVQQRKRDGLIVADKNAWFALQQQNPLRISGAIFPRGAWQWYRTTGPDAFDLRQLDEIHISVDGNVKETGQSFAVIGVYGVIVRMVDGAVTKHYFRLDESRGHYEFSTLRDETLRLWSKWRRAHPNLIARGRVWVEDKANGPALMSQLAGHGIPFEPVPKSRSKVSCYRMAQLPVLENRCWLPLDSDGLVTNDWVDGPQGFVSELQGQPKTPDDRADEFAQMIICNDPNLGIGLLKV